jgi:hypothetical protein
VFGVRADPTRDTGLAVDAAVKGGLELQIHDMGELTVFGTVRGRLSGREEEAVLAAVEIWIAPAKAPSQLDERRPVEAIAGVVQISTIHTLGREQRDVLSDVTVAGHAPVGADIEAISGTTIH